MINSFENYLKLGKVKRKTRDPEEAKALFQQSKERMEYIQLKHLNEKNAKFILQDSYEVIRESAQSLMSIDGFKPYSHEATISFLIRYYPGHFSEEDIFKFDRFRQIRNDSVYKAAKVMETDARDSFSYAGKFIQKVRSLLIQKTK